jgi:acetolactate synthase-1/2/3 large subunit
VVTDSGLHQTLARRHLEVLSPRGLIVPSDFQSMGFGLPAAIGAKLAAPDRAVVAVIGDGGFAMSAMELLTAVRERIALTLVVFNDGQLNRIRLQQLAQYGHAAGCEILNPDFEAFANAVGVAYARGDGDVEGMLRTAIQRDSPTLVEVVLGDSAAIRVERARGLARGSARRALRSSPLRWLARRRKSR